MSAKAKAITGAVALIVVMGLLAVPLSYTQVEEGHVGVQKDWGAVNGNTLQPGANWIIPIQQGVQEVEVRPRTYTMSATQNEGDRARADAITVKTVNGTSVDVDVTVRYRVNTDEADQFVEDWNDERQMEQRLIRPTIRSDLRDEASDIQTSEIYTQSGREALTETAEASLNEEFEGEPIVLEEVQVRNIDLPDSIDSALDEKEEAKQRVEVEKERVAQEEARAEQKIVQAEADAEAIEIRGDALKENRVVLQDRYINALEEGETIYVPADGGSIALTKEVDSANQTATA